VQKTPTRLPKTLKLQKKVEHNSAQCATRTDSVSGNHVIELGLEVEVATVPQRCRVVASLRLHFGSSHRATVAVLDVPWMLEKMWRRASTSAQWDATTAAVLFEAHHRNACRSGCVCGNAATMMGDSHLLSQGVNNARFCASAASHQIACKKKS
jgi:hypothetical protein